MTTKEERIEESVFFGNRKNQPDEPKPYKVKRKFTSSFVAIQNEFERSGSCITVDHNNLTKRMTQGKGTGTKVKSSGRKSKPMFSVPDANRGHHKMPEFQPRFTDKEMDGIFETKETLMECK